MVNFMVCELDFRFFLKVYWETRFFSYPKISSQYFTFYMDHSCSQFKCCTQWGLFGELHFISIWVDIELKESWTWSQKLGILLLNPEWPRARCYHFYSVLRNKDCMFALVLVFQIGGFLRGISLLRAGFPTASCTVLYMWVCGKCIKWMLV